MQIKLMGQLRVVVQGSAIAHSRAKKIEALLVYLALEGQRPIRRDMLHGLIFPESTEAHARTALRQTLRRLRQQIGDVKADAPYLLITPESIQWNPASKAQIDVLNFERLLNGCGERHDTMDVCTTCLSSWHAAAELVHGRFLDSFFLADCARFEQWVDGWRGKLQVQAADLLNKVVTWHGRRSEYELALRYARQLVQQDAWDEAAQRQLLLLLARAGQRTQALKQYKVLVKLLDEELGVEPEPETQDLIKRIKRASGQRPHNLPAQLPSFIGRKTDLGAIHSALATPERRLITLVGPGGIGKSRLALEVGKAVVHDRVGPFIDGVYFVSLVDHDAVGQLPFTLAELLGIPIKGGRSAESQLFGQLKRRELLLILDNFEQLVDVGGAAFVQRLLQATRHLRLIVTSRIVLPLWMAWTYTLDGLPVPAAEAVIGRVTAGAAPQLTPALDAAAYGALLLFEARAARSLPDFAFAAQPRAEQLAMVQICQLADGVPLALELAAAWVRVLSCQQIAAEIALSLDLLEQDQVGVADRHRNMRAVFEWSWRLLSTNARALLAQLSVFRQDFDWSAAIFIASADRRTLAQLIEHSLVQTMSAEGAKRYRLHELLRQFAAEKVEAVEQAPLLTRFSTHYLAFAQPHYEALSNADQGRALQALDVEISHLRQAWLIVTGRGELEQIEQLSFFLQAYFSVQSKYRAGLALYQTGLQRLERHYVGVSQTAVYQRVWAALNYQIGTWQYELGRLDAAEQTLQMGLVVTKSADRSLLLKTYSLLASIARLRGNMLDSDAYVTAGIETARAEGNRYFEGFIHLSGCATSLALGNFDAAETSCQAALDLFHTLAYPFGLAHALRWQGVLTRTQGYYARSESVLQRSLALCRQNNDTQGQAMVHSELAALALCRGESAEAPAFARESLRLNANSGGSPMVKANALKQLGLAFHAEAQPAAAVATLGEALDVATEAMIVPLALSIALDVADKIVQVQNGVKILQLVQQIRVHDAADWQTRQQADQLYQRLTKELTNSAEPEMVPLPIFETIYRFIEPEQ